MVSMRVNRGLLGWGVFFIVLGAVPLAVQSGALDADVVRNAWNLWPLVLIGIGLSLVLARTRFAVLGGLVVAVTFGLMGGALLATGITWGTGFGTCGFGGGGGESFPAQAGTFTRAATVRLEMDCGEVTATAADGSGWTVDGTADAGRTPDVQADEGRLAVRTPDRAGMAIGADGSRWQVTLPRDVAVAMDLTVNAGSGDLDLAGMTVPSLGASVNAGEARLDLSGSRGTERVDASVNAGSLVLLLPMPSGTLRGNVSVNAGSAEICLPDGVAVRINAGDQPLGSTNFGDRGLVRSGNTWSSPGYESAATRVELNVSVNLGSVALDPEDGCD
jgi:hypothetical protein